MSVKENKVGTVHILATYNNTIVTITVDGNVVASASAGILSFKGSKKSTPYAGGLIVAEAIRRAELKKFQFSKVYVKLKGVGHAREAAVRAIVAAKIPIIAIIEATGIPHNGCRPPKKPQK